MYRVLPVDVLFKSKVRLKVIHKMAFGGRSLYKMSDETFDFVCTDCAENGTIVEAVQYCKGCYGYCCQPCVDVHKKFRAMKYHKMVGPSQGNQSSGQQPRLPEFPVERCHLHKGKVLNQYCDIHDEVGCMDCIADRHMSCNKRHVHSVPDMIDTLFNLPDSKRTHNLLKDMIASLDQTDQTKDGQLSTLKIARTGALGKVDIFQKALEAIIRSKADATRNEVEKVYKQVEGEIIDKQQAAGHTTDDLKTLDEKLTQSEGNRAQRFVCDKVTQSKMKEADNLKSKQWSPNVPDVQIEFIPDQALIESIKALPGIGQVQKHTQPKSHGMQKHGKQHPGLYKIKSSKDINIKLADDTQTCGSWGSSLTEDDQLLVTDYNNKMIKRIDLKNMLVIDYCSIDSTPFGICCISSQEAALACRDDNMIQFISINNQITPTRRLKMPHPCYGIAYHDRKLYVTDNDSSLHVYDMSGKCLHTVSRDDAGNHLFNASRHITLNASDSRMYVGGWDRGLICLDESGKYISSVQDTVVNRADGVCTDNSGNVFVVGYWSKNVVQYSEDGEMVGEVVKSGDGLQCPRSVSYHPGLGYLFLTMYGNVVKMYELE